MGILKALVAIEQSILTPVWHFLSENTDYQAWSGTTTPKATPNVSATPLRFDPIQAA